MLNSKKLMALAFILSSLIYINVSKASEEVVANVSADVFTDSYQLVIDTNEVKQTLNAFHVDNVENGHLLKRKDLLVKDFIDNGVRFPVKGKIVFARISGENFDQEQGGVIVIDTLSNLLTGARKTYELTLAKDKRGWKLFNSGKVITQIKAIANKLPIIGVVGAKDLVMK